MIYGERIRLRKPERDDLSMFVEWLNDPDVRAGLSLYLPMAMFEEERWFERMVDRDANEHPLTIEVPEGDGWRAIGNCGLFGIDWRVRSAEFGIMIGDKPYWNRGFGTEATRLILKHGFDTLNLNRMYLRVNSNNPRARRTYEKAGYIFEGTFRQAEYQDGKYMDMHVMSVLRREWEERRER